MMHVHKSALFDLVTADAGSPQFRAVHQRHSANAFGTASSVIIGIAMVHHWAQQPAA